MMTPVDTQDNSPPRTETGLPPQGQVIELVSSLWKTHVTAAIASMGVPDRLAAGPRTAAELAAALSADPDAMERLARAGASLGLLEYLPPDQYALTGLGQCLVTGPGSLRDFAVVLTDPGQLRPLERLAQAIATGRPTATAALGKDIWAYLREHPDEARHFAGAMTGLSASSAPLVATALDASPYQRIVDVGGGHDFLLSALLRGAPDASGVLFDLPEVVAATSPAPAIEIVGGSFFDAVPADGDLYLLAHVLHDWDDAHGLTILCNCHRAGRPGHTLAVVELLLPELPGYWLPFLIDLQMLVTNGGRERTAGQYRALLADGGYELERIIDLPGGQSILLAHA
jgi:hypothetical protein